MGQPSSPDTGPADPAAIEAARATAFRQRARRLLENQRARIRQVEAELAEQVGSLFDLVRAEKHKAFDEHQQLQSRIDDLQQRLRDACRAQREAEQLLEEAQQHRPAAAARQEETDHQALELRCAALTKECQRLRAEMDEAARQRDAAVDEKTDELRQRLEMAVQELRRAKADQAELAEENTRLKSQRKPAAPAASMVDSGNFDWESQKRRLLAQLETDFDATQEEEARAKLTIEGAIRITDQVVAEREAEIEELKRLLNEQSGHIGNMAVGAAAVAAVLDQDELVREERENLRRLQDEWREKLRQAEVNISVERAKIARERVALEERIRNFESERDALLATGGAEEPNRKGPKGNWLSRLGLKDE